MCWILTRPINQACRVGTSAFLLTFQPICVHIKFEAIKWLDHLRRTRLRIASSGLYGSTNLVACRPCLSTLRLICLQALIRTARRCQR